MFAVVDAIRDTDTKENRSHAAHENNAKRTVTHATAASAPPASVLEALERARAACAGDDQAADTLSTWIEMMRDTSATLREGERQLESHMQRYHKYMEERDLPDENSQPPERDPTCIGFESTRARLEDHICNLERSCLAVEDAAAYVLCSGGAARASRRRTSGSPGTAGAGCASASWELSPPTSVDIARDPEFQRKMKTVDYFFSLTRQESLTLDEDHWIDADDADAPAGYGRAVDASK